MATLGQFLVDRLAKAGVRHGFHIPGDYSLPMYKHFDRSPIQLVGTTTERAAGLAADAYARVNGIGLCMVTYCVGGFNALDAIAGAFAEKSPVVIISGSPGMKERQEGMLLHHMVKTFECQHEVFSNVTCANTVLRDPAKACFEIDRVLEAVRTHRRPVYIEVPRDMVDRQVSYALDQGTPKPATSDEEVLGEVLDQVTEYINSSQSPIILAGEEIARYGLHERLRQLAEKTKIPVATTLLGKSVFNERHPLSLGVYAGGMSRDEVAEVVDQSDCLIMLGVMQTDVNLGFMPLKIGKRKIVLVTSEACQIRNSFFKDVVLREFVDGLLTTNIRPRASGPATEDKVRPEFTPKGAAKITVARFFAKIDSILTDKTAIVADIGDSLFGAADLTVHNSMQFLSPAFYTSMGFAVPGTLGVMIARPGSPAAGVRRRRGVPDDGHGDQYAGSPRPEPEGFRPKQPGLRDRANDPRRPVQRHPAVEFRAAARGHRRRQGVRRGYGRRLGTCPGRGPAVQGRVHRPRQAWRRTTSSPALAQVYPPLEEKGLIGRSTLQPYFTSGRPLEWPSHHLPPGATPRRPGAGGPASDRVPSPHPHRMSDRLRQRPRRRCRRRRPTQRHVASGGPIEYKSSIPLRRARHCRAG
jgi:indolepyruvate decarboxylase